MAEMPFAVGCGGVALLLADFGDGHFLVAEPVGVVGAERSVDADTIGVAAGQQSGARRGADGLRGVPVREHPPFAGHAIEIGSLESFGAEDADVGVALVVGENDNDVWRAFLGGHRRRGDQGRENDGEEGEQSEGATLGRG